ELLNLPMEYVRAAVVIAAMPPGMNGYIFAAMYDRAMGVAASSLIVANLLSVFTITAWLALLQHLV
ncbi:MAG: AEC family transporter, partial [Nitratireductor sp.]|nr:AEC family transporter [Nitratireductor sp.]